MSDTPRHVCAVCAADISHRLAASKGRPGRPPRYCHECSDGGGLYRRGLVVGLALAAERLAA